MDVFISYRRDGALDLAGRLYERLNQLGYSAFYDIESLSAGMFNQQIYEKITDSINFVLVLPPHGLDRCMDEEDWVRKEVTCAMQQGKHMVLIFMQGFEFPATLPAEMENIRYVQGLHYNPTMFNETVEKLINYLVDDKGGSLRVAHGKLQSNMYYENGGMSDFESNRIRQDRLAVKKYEDELLDELLVGKQNVVVFNPAIYELTSVMEKYDRPEISKVIGFVWSEQAATEANERYGAKGNRFYAINIDNPDFANIMDSILVENNLEGFDFVELTLILKDSNAPFKKLQQISGRLNDDAIVFVRELDDDITVAAPDPLQLFVKLKNLFKVDKYAGGRNMGRNIYSYLQRAGATKVKMYNKMVTTVGLNSRGRKVLFDTYFSYLIPELQDLAKEEPNNDRYKEAICWLEENYSVAEELFLSKEFFFLSGFLFFYGIFNKD